MLALSVKEKDTHGKWKRTGLGRAERVTLAFSAQRALKETRVL